MAPSRSARLRHSSAALFSRAFGLAGRSPVTGSGVAAAALAAIALAAGRHLQDFVLATAGAGGLALFVLSGLAALAQGLLARRHAAKGKEALAPLRAVEGRPAETGRRWPDAWVPLAAPIRIAWRVPPGEARLRRVPGGLAETVVFRDRALVTEAVRELVAEDVLGFWRIRFRARDDVRVRVLPDPGRLSAAELVACLASADLMPYPFGRPTGDRVDSRTYTRSDPARFILWKVYARTRELMVRVPEPARSPERAPLIFLAAGREDAPAAALVLLLLEGGLLGPGARFAADGSPDPSRDPEAVRDAIARSSSFRERGGRDLSTALGHPSLSPEDPVVIVGPAADEAWMAEVAGTVAADPSRFVVLAAADAHPPARTPAGWRRILFRPPPEGGRPVPALARKLGILTEAGARVLLADRAGGRIVPVAPGPAAANRRRAG
ncbi:MAG: DUF58 domain-containing protein [Acidobacteria bacterium]|nr:MAG: DUF58 domain-containing protein [Acidobacteriota bacterium]